MVQVEFCMPFLFEAWLFFLQPDQVTGGFQRNVSLGCKNIREVLIIVMRFFLSLLQIWVGNPPKFLAKTHMGVSKNRGTPKWMVKIMENPIKIDDLGAITAIFRNTHMIHHLWVFLHHLLVGHLSATKKTSWGRNPGASSRVFVERHPTP